MSVRILSQEAMQKIHQAALDILADPGLEFTNVQGLDRLREQSVKVDMDKHRVYLSADAVLE